MENQKIFEEIDEAIKQCTSEKPVPYEKSKFKKLYEEIKERWKVK